MIKMTVLSSGLDYNGKLYESNQQYRDMCQRADVIVAAESPDREKLEALQQMAYDNFQHVDATLLKLYSDNYRILSVVILSPNRNVSDVASVLLQTIADIILEPERDPKPSTSSLFERVSEFYSRARWCIPRGEFRLLVGLPQRETYRQRFRGIRTYFFGGERIYVSHGGGRRFLEQFLAGKNKGYAMEAGNKGLFVSSPADRERDRYYAFRTPIDYFDDPMIIRGWIDSAYLHTVNNNGYEAVIYQKDIDKLHIETKVVYPFLSQQYNNLSPVNTLVSTDASGRHIWKPIEKIAESYSPERLERIGQCYLYSHYGRQITTPQAVEIFLNESDHRGVAHKDLSLPHFLSCAGTFCWANEDVKRYGFMDAIREYARNERKGQYYFLSLYGQITVPQAVEMFLNESDDRGIAHKEVASLKHLLDEAGAFCWANEAVEEEGFMNAIREYAQVKGLVD